MNAEKDRKSMETSTETRGTAPSGFGRFMVEGLVIVVSILMAFAIDAWWAERQVSNEREALKASLTQELESSIVTIREVYSAIDADLVKIDEFLEARSRADFSSMESMGYALYAALNYQEAPLFVATLDSAIAGGGIELIESKEFRLSVSRFNRARTLLDEYAKLAITRFFVGPVYDLQREVGDLRELFLVGSNVSDPGNDGSQPSLSEERLKELYSGNEVYALVFSSRVLKSNQAQALRDMEQAAVAMLAALSER